jgi:peptidoglycan/LPS O-acetylase OafA/YrhL
MNIDRECPSLDRPATAGAPTFLIGCLAVALSHAAATAVGKYSYAIYLLHSPIRDGRRSSASTSSSSRSPSSTRG